MMKIIALVIGYLMLFSYFTKLDEKREENRRKNDPMFNMKIGTPPHQSNQTKKNAHPENQSSTESSHTDSDPLFPYDDYSDPYAFYQDHKDIFIDEFEAYHYWENKL